MDGTNCMAYINHSSNEKYINCILHEIEPEVVEGTEIKYPFQGEYFQEDIYVFIETKFQIPPNVPLYLDYGKGYWEDLGIIPVDPPKDAWQVPSEKNGYQWVPPEKNTNESNSDSAVPDDGNKEGDTNRYEEKFYSFEKNGILVNNQNIKYDPSIMVNETRKCIKRIIYYDVASGQINEKILTDNRRWLNSDIIKTWMNLLQLKSYEGDYSENSIGVLDSFNATKHSLEDRLSKNNPRLTYTQADGKKKDLRDFKKIFVPFNLNSNHWILLYIDKK